MPATDVHSDPNFRWYCYKQIRIGLHKLMEISILPFCYFEYLIILIVYAIICLWSSYHKFVNILWLYIRQFVNQCGYIILTENHVLINKSS